MHTRIVCETCLVLVEYVGRWNTLHSVLEVDKVCVDLVSGYFSPNRRDVGGRPVGQIMSP